MNQPFIEYVKAFADKLADYQREYGSGDGAVAYDQLWNPCP